MFHYYNTIQEFCKMIWIILNLFKWLQMLSSYLNYFINVQFFVKWLEWSVWRKMEFTSVQQISLRMTEVLFKLKTIVNDNVNVVVVDKRTKRERKKISTFFISSLSSTFICLFVWWPTISSREIYLRFT